MYASDGISRAASSPPELHVIRAGDFGRRPFCGSDHKPQRRYPSCVTRLCPAPPHELISTLNFAFMGAFEARKGPWSVLTDLIYANASGSRSATRSPFIRSRFRRA